MKYTPRKPTISERICAMAPQSTIILDHGHQTVQTILSRVRKKSRGTFRSARYGSDKTQVWRDA